MTYLKQMSLIFIYRLTKAAFGCTQSTAFINAVVLFDNGKRNQT